MNGLNKTIEKHADCMIMCKITCKIKCYGDFIYKSNNIKHDRWAHASDMCSSEFFLRQY